MVKGVFCQGDILWLDFQPQAGHEQTGRRPALVVSSTAYNATGALVMVCPITHTKSRLVLRPQLPEGMQTDGYVLCDHARFVDLQARNAAFAERAPAELTDAVLQILLVLLARDPASGGKTEEMPDSKNR